MNPTAKHVKDTLLNAGPEMVLEAFASIARMRSLTPDANGSDWSPIIRLIDPPKLKRAESRSDRFSEAQGELGNAKSVAEELRDELQNWHDNMPENMQSGSKADELDEAIQELDSFISACEEAEGISPNFPGMR